MIDSSNSRDYIISKRPTTDGGANFSNEFFQSNPSKQFSNLTPGITTSEENMVSVESSMSLQNPRNGANTNPAKSGGDFCGDDTAKNLIKGFGNYQNNMMNINHSISVKSKKKKGRRTRKSLHATS